jgi:CP12 domain
MMRMRVVSRASSQHKSLVYRRTMVVRLRENAISHAKRVCQETPRRPECAIAWDLVEDYDHALRRLKDAALVETLESYCEESPSDLECRVYDV